MFTWTDRNNFPLRLKLYNLTISRIKLFIYSLLNSFSPTGQPMWIPGVWLKKWQRKIAIRLPTLLIHVRTCCLTMVMSESSGRWVRSLLESLGMTMLLPWGGRPLGQHLNPSPYTKTREIVCFSTPGNGSNWPMIREWIHDFETKGIPFWYTSVMQNRGISHKLHKMLGKDGGLICNI